MLLESITAAILISGANYADYHTTRNGLASGAIEFNPLIGQQGQRLELVKTIAVVGETAIFYKIHKSGKKKLAWTFVAVIVGTNLVIAHKNSN